MYQLIKDSTSIKRIADGAFIPADPANTDYAAYLAWLAEGNTPEPAPQDSIEARRAEAWGRVKAERTLRVNGGAQVSGNWYHTDVDSRVQHMRLDAKAAAVLADGGSVEDVLTIAGQPIYWKTLSNSIVPMTVGLAQAIPVAIEVLDAQAFARAETLRAQIEVSEDPESIDIGSGWPSIYKDTL